MSNIQIPAASSGSDLLKTSPTAHIGPSGFESSDEQKWNHCREFMFFKNVKSIAGDSYEMNGVE